MGSDWSFNRFPCLGTVIHTLEMLLDFRKAEETRPAARVLFYTFLNSGNNMPRVWISVSKHGNVFGTS